MFDILLLRFCPTINGCCNEGRRVTELIWLATQSIGAYSMSVEGRVVTLVDTPGFDDTTRTDAEVFEEVVSWLTRTYQSRSLLSGIIYVHPITSTRMRGSAVRSLDVFSRLVGPDSFQNITLVTTMWDLLPDQSVGELREEQLREDWWRGLIEKGSITARSSGDRDSALIIMKRTAFDQRMAATSGAPLAIQKEIVDERKPLEATSAFEALHKRLEDMEQRHRDQLTAVEQDHLRDKTRMRAEIDKLKEERADLHRQKSVQVQEVPAVVEVSKIQADIYVRMSAGELLEIDPPPAYTPKALSRYSELLSRTKYFGWYSLVQIRELQRSVKPSLGRLLRPRLQIGSSRLEWTCVSHPGFVLWSY